jgi:hypothetical protein
MNLINKKHTVILDSKKRRDCYMSVSEKMIWISSEAVRRFGLTAGKHLNFLNDGREWSFFQNDDPDGFFLQHNGKQSSKALVITCRPLTKMILNSTGFKSGTWFYLLGSKIEKDGNRVVQIITNKTYDEFMKAL